MNNRLKGKKEIVGAKGLTVMSGWTVEIHVYFWNHHHD